MPSRTICRILLIEDNQESASALAWRLREMGKEIGLAVDTEVLSRSHLHEFKAQLEEWYSDRTPDDSTRTFDFTSLDIIFKEAPDYKELSGGERLHAWLLCKETAIRQLGQIVVRSNTYSDYFRQFGSILYVPKETNHELRWWKQTLIDYKS